MLSVTRHSREAFRDNRLKRTSTRVASCYNQLESDLYAKAPVFTITPFSLNESRTNCFTLRKLECYPSWWWPYVECFCFVLFFFCFPLLGGDLALGVGPPTCWWQNTEPLWSVPHSTKLSSQVLCRDTENDTLTLFYCITDLVYAVYWTYQSTLAVKM